VCTCWKDCKYHYQNIVSTDFSKAILYYTFDPLFLQTCDFSLLTFTFGPLTLASFAKGWLPLILLGEVRRPKVLGAFDLLKNRGLDWTT
jgi:hypothetical protein